MPDSHAAIPTYSLYGETPGDVDPGFVHLETIPARSRPVNWTIRPHRHEHLRHFLLVESGGGWFQADAERLAFRAPAFLAVPLQVVHGFAFEPETDGRVLTLSESFTADALSGIREPALRAVLALPLRRNLDDDAAWRQLVDSFTAIGREFHQPAIGSSSAIAAHIALILTAVVRQGLSVDAAAPPASPDAALVARLRPLIEQRFREHWGVEAYAAALGVTPGRLTAACRRIAAHSPLRLVHARLLLEAKRSLIYTGMTMNEIAYALGFEDPAYFSRFFTKREGVTPLAYRQRHTTAA